MASYIMADVLCPFYQGDVGVRLVCEGLTNESVCSVRFKTKYDWTNYVNEKCCADYKACLLYKALLAKYE